jgi:23S rRNA (cytidine1920-2'-O)/16S rRNA (cytidine1409-2'-O)-methyltransferase
MKQRLDLMLVKRAIVPTRSQGESYIRLGYVRVNGQVVTKAGSLVNGSDHLELTMQERYVSRAGLKLASVAQGLGLNFKGQTVLDVGSSTGGFTDYALRNGSCKVIAVDEGTDQLHPSLRGRSDIELHEKTDIRSFQTTDVLDVVLIDVSLSHCGIYCRM